jgi:hypothetical protein
MAGRMLVGGLVLLLSAWAACLDAQGIAVRGERPGIFLEAADIYRARALAMDAALSHGWGVIERGPSFVVFETYLEEPAVPGPPNDTPPPFTLLRIRADFIRQPAGVNVYLFAQEVWFPRDSREWVVDVTPLYRPNLRRALKTLQARWDGVRRSTGMGFYDDGELNQGGAREEVDSQPGPADETGDQALPDDAAGMPPSQDDAVGLDGPTEPGIDATMAPQPPGEPLADAAPLGAVDVGQWAYYAEHYAERHGCALGDLGAVLIDENGVTEVHRVHCQDGSSLDVRCDSRNCALTH